MPIRKESMYHCMENSQASVTYTVYNILMLINWKIIIFLKLLLCHLRMEIWLFYIKSKKLHAYISIDSEFLWQSWPGSVSLRSEKTFFSPATDSEGQNASFWSYQTTGASSSLLQSLPCASWQTVAEMPALFKEWSFSFPLPHKTVEDEAPSKLLLPPQSLQAFRLSLWSSALLRCCLSCLVSLFFFF